MARHAWDEPRAEATVDARFQHEAVLMSSVLARALDSATSKFRKKHGRWPEWDQVMFRGAFTTGKCTIEIAEVE